MRRWHVSNKLLIWFSLSFISYLRHFACSWDSEWLMVFIVPLWIMVYFFIRFESDMLLQCYKAIADFIRNLQDNVDSSMKIQEYLTRKECFIMQKIWSNSFSSNWLMIVSFPSFWTCAKTYIGGALNSYMTNMALTCLMHCGRKLIPVQLLSFYVLV